MRRKEGVSTMPRVKNREFYENKKVYTCQIGKFVYPNPSWIFVSNL
jgi:hypothetical protein